MRKSPARFLTIAIPSAVLLFMAAMSIINSRITRLQVQVTGAVDEVRIFRSDDSVNPIAVIQTNGVDTTLVVKLRSSESFSPFLQTAPASYSFTTHQGGQVYQGRKICCETGLLDQRITLTISGLSEWQEVDQ